MLEAGTALEWSPSIPTAAARFTARVATPRRLWRANLQSAVPPYDRVEVVVATSKAAAEGWTRPVALLWIDGDHEYSSVREDFLLLGAPHVVDGGVVALHDTLYLQGPARVVSEFL